MHIRAVFLSMFAILLLSGLFMTAKSAQNKKDSFIDFEDVKAGSLPDGWSSQLTGRGKPGKWAVVDDGGNRVLAQLSGKGRGYHFNMAILDAPTYKDLEYTVRFKAISGREDQGGGPVWRFQDADNYYIARANPLEDNFRVYKVVNGRRIQMDSARLKVTSGKWHSIRIRMKGDHMECYYDGRKYLEANDRTFRNSGKIGVWTKADSVAYFDDLSVRNLDEAR